MSPNAPTRPLILASTSRYRASLLQRFGLPYTAHNPAVDEVERHGETPRGRAFRLSEAKAEALGIVLFERIDTEDPTAIIGLPLIWLAGALRAVGFAVP